MLGWLLRRRRRTRDERGAVAVEAALVTPMLLLLVFGMIEMSFLVRDYASVSSLSRAGVRVASTGAGEGPASSTTCGTGDATLPPCAPATVPQLAQLAADAVQRSGSALPNDMVKYVLIYKANSAGFPGAESNRTMPTSCTSTANCVMFTWQASRDGFRYNNGTWVSSTISACFPGTATTPLDRVGVYVNADHPMLTGLFGTKLNMGDRTVMNFEPLPAGSCNGRGVLLGGHA